MKKRTACILVILAVICSACCGAAGKTDPGSRVAGAYQILFASAEYAVIREEENGPACMIRMSDGETVFESIVDCASTGPYLCVQTEAGAFVMDGNGSVTRLEEQFTDHEWGYWTGGKFGLFYSVSYDRSCLYDPAGNTYTELPDNEICDVYRDSKGKVYILTRECGIFRPDGKEILKPGKYKIAWNCNFEPITNGYLTAWDRTNSAVVLSPYTGKVIHTFTGMGWEAYDENHQIYRDSTAVIGPADSEGYYSGAGTTVVGLDGTVLTELRDGYVFSARCEGESGYPIETGSGGMYNPLTDRTYYFEGEYDDPARTVVCEETGEAFRVETDGDGYITGYRSEKTGKTYTADEWPGDYEALQDRAEKYRPVQERTYWLRYIEADREEPTSPYMMPYRVEILCPDGTVLGNRYWKDIASGWVRQREMIEGYDLFEDVSVCAVVDENDLCAVVNTKGKTVLPSEYEQVSLIGTFSGKAKGNGYALAARKDGQWHVFDLKGKPLLTGGTETASAAEPSGSGSVPRLSGLCAGTRPRNSTLKTGK